jgi:hypothetical protein
MKNINHNGFNQLNRLGPTHVPDGYRDYHGCIRMDPDKYPWMVDKFLWIWMISMDYPHHPQN